MLLGCVGVDHPRIRGEHYVNSTYPALAAGSSPHTRGAPQLGRRPSRRSGIIPAYAGSTRVAGLPGRCQRDHPRIRGEHFRRRARRRVVAGSSPHTRGALNGANIGYKARRIIPAYAGSTMASYRLDLMTQDHPRIRGEHVEMTLHKNGLVGIIPAYAGSTCGAGGRRTAIPDHPRIRGEHCRRQAIVVTPPGSSPHTRGAPADDFVVV